MAKELGMSQSAIARIWRAFSLQPHRTRRSSCPRTLSSSRRCETSWACISIRPSARSSSASMRSRRSRRWIAPPLLPMRPACPNPHARLRPPRNHVPVCSARRANRKGDRPTPPRHRAQEFKKFLDAIDLNVPERLEVHLILDNLSTHKTRHSTLVRQEATLPPALHADERLWINLVERWFALLTQKQIRRGTHRSTRQLEDAIKRFLAIHNEDPKPFIWTKTADEILDRSLASASELLTQDTRASSAMRPLVTPCDPASRTPAKKAWVVMLTDSFVKRG